MSAAQSARTAEMKARALPLLAEGKTAVQVAAELGVAASTVRMWLSRDPVMRSEVYAARLDGMEGASLTTAAGLPELLEALHGIAMDQGNPAVVRVRAIATYADITFKLRSEVSDTLAMDAALRLELERTEDPKTRAEILRDLDQ